MKYQVLRLISGAVLAISAAFVFEAFRRWGSPYTASSPMLTVALAYGLPLLPLVTAIVLLVPLNRADGFSRWITRALIFFCGAAGGIFLFSGISTLVILHALGS